LQEAASHISLHDHAKPDSSTSTVPVVINAHIQTTTIASHSNTVSKAVLYPFVFLKTANFQTRSSKLSLSIRHLAEIAAPSHSIPKYKFYLYVAHCISELLLYFTCLFFFSSRKVILINILLTRTCVERTMVIRLTQCSTKAPKEAG
jgi:hypothetical protein